jgi:hypothetical protein
MNEAADLDVPTGFRILAAAELDDKGSALIELSGSDKPRASGEFESRDRSKRCPPGKVLKEKLFLGIVGSALQGSCLGPELRKLSCEECSRDGFPINLNLFSWEGI